MYQRIKNSLIEPKKIANYVNDKFWKLILYIVVLSFLLLLPKISEVRYLSSDIKSAIRDNVQINDEVEYIIKDNQLQSINSEAINYTYYVNFENNTIGYNLYVSIGESINYQKIKYPTASIILHYATDGVYFVMPLSTTEDGMDLNYKLCDYNGYEIDLRNLHLKESDERNQFFNIIKHFIDSKMPLIYAVSIPMFFVSSAIEILIVSLMMGFISYLINKKFNIKFKVVFKLVVYSMFPYVLGYLFSQFFNGSMLSVLFYYVGFFATITYFMIAIKQYLITQYSNYRKEDENNE